MTTHTMIKVLHTHYIIHGCIIIPICICKGVGRYYVHMNASRGELRTSTNSVMLMMRKRNNELLDNNFKP